MQIVSQNLYFYLIFEFVLLLIFVILNRRVTRALSNSIIIIFYAFLLFNFFKNDFTVAKKVIFIAFSVFINIVYIFVVGRFTYNFKEKILSYVYIFNSFLRPNIKNLGCDRIIGRVMPYNNYQFKYNGAYIHNTRLAAAGGTLIQGTVGSGKTYTVISLIKQNLLNNLNVIYTDCKGDLDVLNELKDFVLCNPELKKNYDIYIISNEGVNFTYDPLLPINNAGRVEAILNMRKWSVDGSDSHYKLGLQILLQKLVSNFDHIFKKEENSNFTYSFYKYVKEYAPANADERDALSTLSKLLELLITSSLKPLFLPNDDVKNFKFSDYDYSNGRRFLLICSFISSNKELATSFLSLMFKDMLDTCTNLSMKHNIFVYNDEIGSIENPFILKDLAEKGRSAGLAITYMVQDINQFIIKANEAYLDTLLGCINNFLIFSGSTKNTASKIAGVQIAEIEDLIMTLKKPLNGKSPTALYISKYPYLNKNSSIEVFKFEPYICKYGMKETASNTKINYNYGPKDSESDENIESNIEIEVKNATKNKIEEEDARTYSYNDFI